MKLSYEAYDSSGQLATGAIDAPDYASATQSLRRQGLFVANLTEAQDQSTRNMTGPRRWLGRGKRLKHLTFFTRQLFVLISTGTPLAQALQAMERQAKDPVWRATIEDIRIKVQQGSALSEAMQSHPDCFDPVYRNLIAIGEASSRFEAVLQRLAELTRKRQQVRSNIIGAMIYPIVLVCISIAVLLVLLVGVLPRFTELFESMEIPLPPTTVFLVYISEALTQYWWALIPSVGLLVAGVVYLCRVESGKRTRDSLVLRLPTFGRITRSFATAQLVRLIGVLLNSHVPLLEALRLCKQALTNVHYSDLIARAEEAVTRGEPVSSVFADNELIAPYVYEAIRNGEQSGQVGPLLLNVADFIDDENDVILRSLTSILEPFILVALGVVVGFVAVSLFIPLFDLTAMAGGAP